MECSHEENLQVQIFVTDQNTVNAAFSRFFDSERAGLPSWMSMNSEQQSATFAEDLWIQDEFYSGTFSTTTKGGNVDEQWVQLADSMQGHLAISGISAFFSKPT
jgi:hypothetical protein